MNRPELTFDPLRAASLRFQCVDVSDLIADWKLALQTVAVWREQTGGPAATIHLVVHIPRQTIWPAAGFLVSRLLTPPSDRPPELRGLSIDLEFADVDGSGHFRLVLFPG